MPTELLVTCKITFFNNKLMPRKISHRFILEDFTAHSHNGMRNSSYGLQLFPALYQIHVILAENKNIIRTSTSLSSCNMLSA